MQVHGHCGIQAKSKETNAQKKCLRFRPVQNFAILVQAVSARLHVQIETEFIARLSFETRKAQGQSSKWRASATLTGRFPRQQEC